jgi:hypothetical protein
VVVQTCDEENQQEGEGIREKKRGRRETKKVRKEKGRDMSKKEEC